MGDQVMDHLIAFVASCVRAIVITVITVVRYLHIEFPNLFTRMRIQQ
jgi:hypothetical protein